MSLLSLKSKFGSRKKKKIVGRGDGSGHGTTAGRGGKGQTQRSGGTRRPGFEGGQTPIFRRMPKLKGFRNPNHFEFQPVNIEDLNVFENNSEVTIEQLHKKNLISKKNEPVKLLGDGKLEKTLTITVHKASASAIAAVEAKKGKIILLMAKKEVTTTEENK